MSLYPNSLAWYRNMRYSITVELDAATVEEAISMVPVGDIVELLNLDLLMQHPSEARVGADIDEERSDELS